MTRQVDELDRLIDALNAGDAAPVNETTDPELAQLLDAVIRIRQLHETDQSDDDWPRRAVAELARDLRADRAGPSDRESAEPAPHDCAPEVAPVDLPPRFGRVREEAPTQRHVSREFAKMVAAILVLVLVTGVLAVTFRGQGGSQPGDFVGAQSPTDGASGQLPLSVTANGITVTLQMVDYDISATRFYVDVAIPPYDPGYGDVLGQSPADDIQVEGMNVGANALRADEVDATSSTDPLWLTYTSPFPANRTVTLTIKQLWFPAKPTSATPKPTDFSKYTPVPVIMQALNDPWTFQITPSMVASQPLPTPASGVACTDIQQSPPPDIDCYGNISANLAQKLVGFPIIEPKPLPTSLTRDAFTVGVRRLGPTSGNRANYVSLSYTPKSGQHGVSLEETTDHAAVPNVTGGTDSTATPLIPNGQAQTQAILPGTLKTMNIDGVAVTRFEDGDVRAPVLHFVWTQSGVSYHLSNTYTYLIVTATPPLITDADLLPLVTSIIEQSSALATPQPHASPTPAPSELPLTPDAYGNYNWVTLAQAQQLAPFHLVQPTWVPSYLDYVGINASELKYTQINPTPVAGPVQTVGLDFSGPATAKGDTVSIVEVKQGAPVEHDDGARTTLTIAGLTVSRTTWSDGTPVPTSASYSGRHASYVWTNQGTTFQLEALMAGPVNEQDVEHMIASMIGQGS